MMLMCCHILFIAIYRMNCFLQFCNLLHFCYLSDILFEMGGDFIVLWV